MFRVIKASEDDMWDPFHGRTYRIDGNIGKTKFTDDPVKAIHYWFMLGRTARQDTCIQCKTKEAAVAVCKAATEDLLSGWMEPYKCPYKLDYLVEEAAKQVANNCRFFHEGEYGDQIHPFSVG